MRDDGEQCRAITLGYCAPLVGWAPAAELQLFLQDADIPRHLLYLKKPM